MEWLAGAIKAASKVHPGIILALIGCIFLFISLLSGDPTQFQFMERKPPVYALAAAGVALVAVGTFLSFLQMRYQRSDEHASESARPTSEPATTPSIIQKATEEITSDFRLKIRQLKQILKDYNFKPNLILGVARGGLVVAARLSQDYGRPIVPTASLWRRPNYDNSYNAFISCIKDIIPLEAESFSILIVDDYCETGSTLYDAKIYVGEHVKDLNVRVRVATAAIHFANMGKVVDHAPDYFVDGQEEEEPPER